MDARSSPTAVNDMAAKRSYEWFENNVIYRVLVEGFPGVGRRVYPGFLQHTGFVAMNPNRHMVSHYDYFKDLIKGDGASVEAHRKFYDEYNVVLDMDANYYLETISTVFQDYKLVHGTWDVRAVDGTVERVRPQDITTTALMTVEGELDDISGAGQTHAAHALCEGLTVEKNHLESQRCRPLRYFQCGRRWRDVVYPEVRAFILRSSKPSQESLSAPAVAPTTPALSEEADLMESLAEAALPIVQAEDDSKPTVTLTGLPMLPHPSLSPKIKQTTVTAATPAPRTGHKRRPSR